jgi:hypothetical protein
MGKVDMQDEREVSRRWVSPCSRRSILKVVTRASSSQHRSYIAIVDCQELLLMLETNVKSRSLVYFQIPPSQSLIEDFRARTTDIMASLEPK